MVAKSQLRILRDAGYVIPPSCTVCAHAPYPSCSYSPMRRCDFLKCDVSALGNCEHFSPDADAVESTVGTFRSLLERRVYTRSNRFKKGVRF
jgi:hypothetical protein